MQKRGQVTVFIIAGIVILAAMILVIFLYKSFQEKAREITNPREYLKSQINDMRKMINKCVSDKTEEVLKKLFESGGHINPVRYANYYDKKITYLCYKVSEEKPCYNMMFTKEDVDNEIRPYLEQGITKCIENGIDVFKNKDYEVNTGDFSLDFVFGDDALLVTVNYPVSLTKGNIEEKDEKFSKDINTNFWKIAKAAADIINMESLGKEVDIADLSSKSADYEIGRTGVLGGSVYMIKPRYGDNTIFYFGVES